MSDTEEMAVIEDVPEQERRQHPRQQVPVMVDYIGHQVLLNHPLADLGEGGLRLESAEPDTPGTAAEVILHRPGQSTTLVLRGEVVWSRDGAPASTGLRFVDPEKGQLRTLRRYLELARGSGAR